MLTSLSVQYRGRADDQDLAGLRLGDHADHGRAQLQSHQQPRPGHRLHDAGDDLIIQTLLLLTSLSE